MKLSILKKGVVAVTLILIGVGCFAQPVSDRAVIPVAVTLNQILRLNVTDGGNIEFVFNRIDQYEDGIANAAIYDTRMTIASSTTWEMNLGAEDATFLGTDDPTQTLDLDYVGFQLTAGGNHTFGAELVDAAGANAAVIGLATYPVSVITSAAAPAGNAGDIDDNVITINWECNTNALNTVTGNTALIDADEAPDRYVTNVLVDIESGI